MSARTVLFVCSSLAPGGAARQLTHVAAGLPVSRFAARACVLGTEAPWSAGLRQAGLLVDEKAVLTDQDRKYVYVLGPGNVAVRKDVVLGRKAGDLRAIDRGLEPNDVVIVHGIQKVFFAGMPVAPSEISMGDPPPDALRVAANAAAPGDAS